MAQKSTKGKKRSKAKTAKKKESPIRDEVVILLVLACSILLMISNFGLGGALGNSVSGFFFGVFGILAYIFPICFFVCFSLGYVNRKNSKILVKLITVIFLFFTIAAFIQLSMVSFQAETTLTEYYNYSSTNQTGGGIIGGLIVKVLCPALGVLGGYVALVTIFIIEVLLITEKSLFKAIKSKTDKINARPKKEIQKKVPTKKTVAKDKKTKPTVSGVTFNTTLKAKETNVPEQVVEPVDTMMPMAEELPDVFEEAKPKKQRITKESKQEVKQEAEEVSAMISNRNDSDGNYVFPSLDLLGKGPGETNDGEIELRNTAKKLQETLANFGVSVQVTNYSKGPSVTRYELQPEQGVKVSRIVGLADDIKLNLAAADIRIEAPIPGKAAVGIEVPNQNNSTVALRDLLETKEFISHKSNIAFAAGKDIAGKAVVTDIATMPHVLIAGATGSGKSVCINTLIMSILFKANPEDVKLIMIDPKVVELSVYNGIPHLMIPVVTEPKKAAGALHWAVAEMTKRYQLFAEYNVRDLKGYNAKVEKIKDIEDENKPQKMPQIIVIVDELADLMMVAPGEVEEAICRLAQLARAAGIHLILATQRPSVNVITGLIKANMPSRIAFAVSSGVDSRTIIDMNGAEKLLGKGDMLFYPSGYPKPARVQGAFVSDKEVQKVVEFLKEHSGEVSYNEEVEKHVVSGSNGLASSDACGSSAETDVYFVDAGKFIIEKDKASIGMLQRSFKIGFNRAARIMDQLCEAGVVGEEEGTKPRKVLMSLEEFERYIEEYI